SDRTDLTPGDTNGHRDVFLWDRTTGRIQRVSVSSDGTQANGSSRRVSISADGRIVAYQSTASTLVGGDASGASDLFVWDRRTSQTVRVGSGNAGSYRPAVSADGRLVAFESAASNLVRGDTNSVQDVFVWNRRTGRIGRVSVPSRGGQGNNASA